MKRVSLCAMFILFALTVTTGFHPPSGFLDDMDDDNDGVIDLVESGGYDALADGDNDAIANYKDATPGCPTPYGHDVYGNTYLSLTWTDCNGDGINDFFDWDRDGIVNQRDLDSDNDGILDIQEARSRSAKDLDNNGMADGADVDNDGLPSSADANDNNASVAASMGLIPQDFDKDNHPNYLDLDSDADGIVDNREALQLDAFASGYNGLTLGTLDDDLDGVRTINYTSNYNDADNVRGFGAKGIVLLDNDGDGCPNPYDIDSDNDGITDNVEGQPTCSYTEPSGIDSDGDGLNDAYDSDLSVCSRKAAGITPYDKEFDGTPDIRDLDTDNDGAPDVNEGSGIYSNFVTKLADADGDGLIDQFDTYDIVSAMDRFNNNVCHNEMGPGGTRNGPVPAGSKAKLPQMMMGECPSADRDWRNVSILPLSLTRFTGILKNPTIQLSWLVENEENINHYAVERSTNGREFTEVANVNAKANTTGTTLYSYDDYPASAAMVYYRLREIDNNGKWKLSKTLNFKLTGIKDTPVTLFPNPASSMFTVSVSAEKEGLAMIRITDMTGRQSYTETKKVSKGLNKLPISNKVIGSGTYNVLVSVDGGVYQKLLVLVR